MLVLIVANKTTDIELIGINMAAIIGERLPVTANRRPMILYKKEITKLTLMTPIVLCVSFKKSGSSSKLRASSMASHAGEKTLMSSDTATPTLLCASAPASLRPSFGV